jgi:hypothetical protein
MKKLLLAFALLISYVSYSQNPTIGHFQQLATVKRGDTLDVAWYYQPVASTDIRTFQVDWQYKKDLFTYLSTTVDAAVNSNIPYVDYKQFDGFKYNTYANGSYSYTADANWAVGRNYLVLAGGNQISGNGYIIHNKYKVNSVASNFVSDTITINWARLFKVDGTSIGDNVATLSNKKLAIFLKGNLTISGKVWFGDGMKSLPTIIATDANTGVVASTTTAAINGTYTLDNIEQNTRYKIQVLFPKDSLINIRDYGVTIADAVKVYNEYTNTDVNQNFGRQYLKYGLSYLIGDVNKTGTLDGGDSYSIYASVSGLRPIDTSKLISVFSKNEYDSLVLGNDQWNTWANFINRGNFIFDSVTTVNLSLDIKYFVLGDVDRSSSSPVYDDNGNLIVGARYIGTMGVQIPDTYAGLNQPLYVPFNVSTNGIDNKGLQFEMRYDPSKVRFEDIVSNIQGPWLQYVTHDATNGIIRFGGMNNQTVGALNGNVMPFKLKFSPIGNADVTTYVYVRKLMDASDKEGDHFDIQLASDRIVLMSRAIPVGTGNEREITASVNPNPNSGLFELVVAFPTRDISMDATVYDVRGNIIKRIGNISSTAYNNIAIKQIDMNNVAAGSYYMVLAGNNNKVTKPFLIL